MVHLVEMGPEIPVQRTSLGGPGDSESFLFCFDRNPFSFPAFSVDLDCAS